MSKSAISSPAGVGLENVENADSGSAWHLGARGNNGKPPVVNIIMVCAEPEHAADLGRFVTCVLRRRCRASGRLVLHLEDHPLSWIPFNRVMRTKGDYRTHAYSLRTSTSLQRRCAPAGTRLFWLGFKGRPLGPESLISVNTVRVVRGLEYQSGSAVTT